MKLLSFQGEVMRRWREFGLLLLLWRRQAGKTTLFAWIALRWMLEMPGCLVTFVSASLSVGREVTERVASLFWVILSAMREQVQAQGLKLETNADGLSEQEYMDLFASGRLEVRVWHSQTICSRLKVIAPNPATARGYTGFVLLDEIGWIGAFRELWDAVEWIAARDPSFRVLMATTPPADDAHYSYELAVPPEGVSFDVNPFGNWYVSQAGVQIHRVDVCDAYAAGVKIFDTRTREEVSPEESRRRALDKDNWDRNMALKFMSGSAAACSLLSLSNAMIAGRDLCLCSEGDFPPAWKDQLGDGQISVGYDLATTEKQKSNPSAITVLEKSGSRYIARLITRFKTGDNDKALAMLEEAIDLGDGRRPRRLVVDGTSERYFADKVKKHFLGRVPVEIVVSSESFPGEEMNYKTYLGNQLVNTLEDNQLILPEAKWVKDDWRLVFKERGLFVNQLDNAGNHGDTFDSTKLALHGFFTGGPVEASAAGSTSVPGAKNWAHSAAIPV